MAQLSELELQDLRHLMSGYDLSACKMTDYAQNATDEKIKNFFEKGADCARQNKEQLMKFLA